MSSTQERMNIIQNCLPRIKWHCDELTRLSQGGHCEMDEMLGDKKTAYVEAVLMQLLAAVQTTVTTWEYHK